MEDLKIREFLAISSGSGYGDGSGSGSGDGSGSGSGDGSGSGSGSGYGSGYGDGSGSGSGSGSGYGSGYGDGSGYGSGYGDGSGLKSLNKMQAHIIDGVQTIITGVRGNVAKGYLVMSDLSLVETFVVKQGNVFAHGANLHEAQQALRDKLFEDMSEEERIAAFVSEHEWDKAYPAQDFFDWHHRLTGSCLMGRKAFVSDHDLSMDREYTVEEFISITQNAYGGEVIRRLKEVYSRQ